MARRARAVFGKAIIQLSSPSPLSHQAKSSPTCAVTTPGMPHLPSRSTTPTQCRLGAVTGGRGAGFPFAARQLGFVFHSSPLALVALTLLAAPFLPDGEPWPAKSVPPCPRLRAWGFRASRLRVLEKTTVITPSVAHAAKSSPMLTGNSGGTGIPLSRSAITR